MLIHSHIYWVPITGQAECGKRKMSKAQSLFSKESLASGENRCENSYNWAEWVLVGGYLQETLGQNCPFCSTSSCPPVRKFFWLLIPVLNLKDILLHPELRYRVKFEPSSRGILSPTPLLCIWLPCNSILRNTDIHRLDLIQLHLKADRHGEEMADYAFGAWHFGFCWLSLKWKFKC